jgi:hypothetical protein
MARQLKGSTVRACKAESTTTVKFVHNFALTARYWAGALPRHILRKYSTTCDKELLVDEITTTAIYDFHHAIACATNKRLDWIQIRPSHEILTEVVSCQIVIFDVVMIAFGTENYIQTSSFRIIFNEILLKYLVLCLFTDRASRQMTLMEAFLDAADETSYIHASHGRKNQLAVPTR